MKCLKKFDYKFTNLKYVKCWKWPNNLISTSTYIHKDETFLNNIGVTFNEFLLPAWWHIILENWNKMRNLIYLVILWRLLRHLVLLLYTFLSLSKKSHSFFSFYIRSNFGIALIKRKWKVFAIKKKCGRNENRRTFYYSFANLIGNNLYIKNVLLNKHLCEEVSKKDERML